MPPADDAPFSSDSFLVDSFTGDNAVYEVDPQAWTCTCEEWLVTRAAFKPHDVRRLCPHLLHVFRVQPDLLPDGFKERDRRIVERLEPLRLGYPICRRIVSLPLPALVHQSGPDSADIFFPRDRSIPWASVLCAEGFFHYHPGEDRWANRRAPADPAHCQILELRIHKALSQEGGPAGQGYPLPPEATGWAAPAHHQHEDARTFPLGEMPNSMSDSLPEAISDPMLDAPLAMPSIPQAPPIPQAPGGQPGTQDYPGPFAAPPGEPPPPLPRPAHDPVASPGKDRPASPPVNRDPLRLGTGSPQRSIPAKGRHVVRSTAPTRRVALTLLIMLTISAVGAFFFVMHAPELSLHAITRSLTKLLEGDAPPPPTPGRTSAADPPPAAGLQTVPGGHWPAKEQARDILKLIEANPSQGRYTITKKLPDSVVLFGVDLDVQSIYHVERYTNGTEDRQSWLGHTMFRLESASQGGSLADVPAGQR
ncbi:hypothetical protein [Megalodesulfovibrio gigas]|uniref:SWIM-type domain-containing protein n=1 Tax=Megalodesulfovibrio gigas (strain ATCC 19364 / DSM 1382 / NCIMB 9332 / VKM B-1759) TaxID=1121448 RepID=T2G7M3_MEGG1|nr:hypothetical protein [Megalodesulfovibrio gigas]AGW12293.1 hypothetical protein DGI_0372 [Megalodesulfovibrio gigas DSM 1382 = ATCC 19364]